MATEDFTTYTEVDESADLTVSATKIDFTNLTRADTSYVYDDKGVGHFSGDYEHLIDIELTSTNANPIVIHWALANVLGDRYDIVVTQTEDLHSVGFILGTYTFYLQEHVAGVGTSDSTTLLSVGTTYYLKIKRDEAVGANGTLYCYIYSDSGRTTLVDTLSVALNEKEDFRYVYGIMSYDDNNATPTFTGFSQNLDLQEVAGGGGGGNLLLLGVG